MQTCTNLQRFLFAGILPALFSSCNFLVYAHILLTSACILIVLVFVFCVLVVFVFFNFYVSVCG